MDGFLPDWLARRALTHPQHPALLDGAVSWTYAELDSLVNAAACRLAAFDVGADRRIALLARNGCAFVVVAHAVGRIGAVLVPLNIRLAPAELAWQLADARVALLLHDAANANLATATAELVPGLHTVALGPTGLEGASGVAIPSRERIALDAVQSIVYTSGTSGRPKGALLTYGNLWWSAVGSALHLGHHRDDRWLAVLPLFHVGGLAILFRGVIGGTTVVVHSAFDPERANQAIDEDRVTLVSVVPTMLRRMLQARGANPYPVTLRCVLLGGGPAPPSLLEECLQRNVPVAPTYGLTEAASQVATLPPEALGRKLGASGLPLPPTEVRIERDGRPLPAGEIGEIAVRGPTVSPGYVGHAAEGAERRHDGWLRTGDLGWLDDEGYLYVCDRRDDLIISGGENVYPAEVEAVLLAHPAVADVAVVGAQDEEWGEVPIAFVTLRAGQEPTEEELIAFCAERLAAFKCPRRITRVDALPRNAAGKLLRRELRQEQ